MSVESASDLAAFFDTDGHATAVTWTPAATGEPATLNAIVDRPYETVSPGGVGQVGAAPQLRVAVSALPSGYANGDAVVIGADSFAVARVMPVGDAATAVVVLRAA